MAIRIIEGVPGSGKTLYAVHHLLKTYYDCDQDGFYKQKKFTNEDGEEQKLRLITNIDGLKVAHDHLDDLVHIAGGYRIFFSNKYQESIFDKKERVVFLIDEAQKIFRKKLTGDWDDVFYYFEYHRHYGHDIYLLTQNAKKVNTEISELREYLIHSKPRVRSLTGEFSYQMISDGDILKRETIKPLPKLFNMYKSRRQAESEKIKNPMIVKTLLMFVLAMSIIGGGAYYVRAQFHPKTTDTNQDKMSETKRNSTKINNKAVNTSEIENQEYIYVKASTASRYEQGKQRSVSIFVGCKMIRDNELQYQTKKVGKDLYVKIPKDEYQIFFPESDKERKDKKQS